MAGKHGSQVEMRHSSRVRVRWGERPKTIKRRRTRARDLDRVLYTLAEGLRVVSVLLWPYLPASTGKLLDALGAPDVALAGAQLGAGSLGRIGTLEVLYPKSVEPEPA
jgi:methionyl-tRNA synthetase